MESRGSPCPPVSMAPFELANLSPTIAMLTGIESIGAVVGIPEQDDHLPNAVRNSLRHQRPIDDRARYIRAVSMSQTDAMNGIAESARAELWRDSLW